MNDESCDQMSTGKVSESTCGTRQSALGVLRDRIEQHEQTVRGLRILEGLVEREELNPMDEALLWELFIRM